jgi:hypothetical protein
MNGYWDIPEKPQPNRSDNNNENIIPLSRPPTES